MGRKKDETIMSVSEVAKVFGVSNSTIRDWSDCSGHLQCTRTASGRRVFQRSEVEALVEKLRVE